MLEQGQAQVRVEEVKKGLPFLGHVVGLNVIVANTSSEMMRDAAERCKGLSAITLHTPTKFRTDTKAKVPYGARAFILEVPYSQEGYNGLMQFYDGSIPNEIKEAIGPNLKAWEQGWAEEIGRQSRERSRQSVEDYLPHE